MNGAAIIDVRGLTKRYGDRTVVDHVDMRVERGRIYGFLGPNGSGKTTTIRMLCGLLTPDDGSGTCLGFDIRSESRKIKREVGYMTQKFGLYEDLSIEENLAFVARVYEVPDPGRKVEDALERLGLASRRTQLAGALSGGWKQRLALAACLLHDPQLLLLDEPTAGVDPKARREFWDHLHELTAAGLTVLVSTHYMDEAERCHQLAYIAYGKLLAQGTAQDLIAHASLTTVSISGPGLAGVARALRTHESIHVASFGTALHVSAQSASELDIALAPFRDGDLRIAPVDTSLEDVFIALMQRSTDNWKVS
ncbi:MAG TPA: ABC transporter ATP-binding protein [Noviherbaspirillum sp.]|nr:ABC transporter ATP-binding protein [Noviherbaspirillum sp.]